MKNHLHMEYQYYNCQTTW